MKTTSINRSVATSLGSVALIIGALGVSTSKADAAMITYGTNVFTNVVAPASQTFQLPKFDTSLGTLTSVKITSTLTGSAILTIFNATGSPQNFTNASVSVPLTVSTTAPSSLSITGTNTIPVGIAPAGFTTVPGVPINITNTENIASSSWGFFQGSGASTFTGTADLDHATFGATSVPNVFFSGTSSLSADVSVTYEYTPTAIPEPMTILGSISALGFMGSLNRRFAKAKENNKN